MPPVPPLSWLLPHPAATVSSFISRVTLNRGGELFSGVHRYGYEVQLEPVLLAIFEDQALVICLRFEDLSQVKMFFQHFFDEEVACPVVSLVNEQCSYQCLEGVPVKIGR